MRLTVTTFMSIDGVMQSPGAPEEDPSGGFDLGGWLPPFFDDETGQYMNEVFDQADAFLLGRRTYEAMAGFWPSVDDPANRVGAQLNALPKHVVTATLTNLVDAYRLVIFPALLGRGTRLFADGTPPSAMRLTDTRTTGRGIVMHTYDAAGPLTFGSVRAEEESR